MTQNKNHNNQQTYFDFWRLDSQKRLLLAALIWSGTGICLTTRSIIFLLTLPIEVKIGTICAGIIIGAGKTHLVFRPLAQKIVSRNQDKKRVFAGKVFSGKNWLLILLMIFLGRALLLLHFPIWIKSLILLLVGTGMLFSCLTFWQAWTRTRSKT